MHITSFLCSIFFVKFCSTLKLILDPPLNSLAALEKFLYLHFSNYEKVLILGDFNVWVNERHMQSFCETYDLKSLTKEQTCYKNLNSPTCISLIFTNVPRSFESTCGVVETGLLNFHLITLTVMRKPFKKIR